MYFPVALAVMFVLAVPPAVLGQTLQVNTPASVVGCEPVQLAWTGGSPPYYLSFVPAGQVAAVPMIQFPPQNGNTYTWLANLPAGTTFTITLRDGEGIQAFSDKVTVLSGPQTSCDQTSSSDAVSGSEPTTVADTNSTGPTGSTANSATPGSSAQPTVPVIAKTTANSNPQPTPSFAQPSSPKATGTTKKHNASESYRFSDSSLQKVLMSVGLVAIVFIIL